MAGISVSFWKYCHLIFRPVPGCSRAEANGVIKTVHNHRFCERLKPAEAAGARRSERPSLEGPGGPTKKTKQTKDSEKAMKLNLSIYLELENK